MPEAYIVDAIRTPTGKKKGSLAGWHPADLGAIPIKAIVERTGIDPDAVDDVVWGCVDAVGPQAGNMGRTCWLAAGYSEAVPGVTIDRQCGSSQQAIHFAAQGVMSGTQDLVIAGGVQNMNAIPISSAMVAGQALGFETPFSGSPAWAARYGDEEVNQIYAAEKIAKTWGISRQDMEVFAAESNARAERAIDGGRFDSQIVPVGDFRMDETVRRGTTLEGLASLKTVREGGLITAGVSSQISDGAAALLIASERAVKQHNLKPRARIHNLTVRGDSPIFMLTAPIPATKYALERAGMKLSDIDLVEINEAFASVALAWAKDLDADLSRVNVNGGAIALGHPLGATGAKLMTTLLYELERTGGRYGLQTMCEGGGLANVTIIETALMPAYAFEGLIPVVDPASYLHPTAVLIGDVVIGPGCYIGPGASLRGDFGRVVVEGNASVQDNCTLHTSSESDVVVGFGCTIGHGSVLHGCRLGRNVLVGMNSVVLDDAEIGEDSLIGALSLVKSDMRAPARSLIVGNPAKVVKEIPDNKVFWRMGDDGEYVRLARRSLADLHECEPLTAMEPNRGRPEGGARAVRFSRSN